MRDYVSKRIGNGPEFVGNMMKYGCSLSKFFCVTNGRA